MDKKIKKILEKLDNNNYEAYLIGGYVRDELLGIKSLDIDICTNALPKDIHKLFNINNKSNYGSINMIIDKYNIDITTFRKDINYINRHPSKVVYVKSLEEDLIRRDFTINTICMDKNGKVVDLLNGVEDLNKRIIRMVGKLPDKLIEDPLRILRAIRFSCILDFDIEEELWNKICQYNYLVKELSKNRIREELDKILLSKNFKKGLVLLEKSGIKKLINIDYENINYVVDLLGMWSQVKVLDIPFTKVEKSTIINIRNVINIGIINNEILYKYGLYICTIAASILNINVKLISKKYNKLPITKRSDIDITSKEIEELVGTKNISKMYSIIEKVILNNELKNKNKDIKNYIRKEVIK